MSELELLEDIATSAVLRLRTETLNAGQPFMINIADLPKDQCYLEFPNGSIQLVFFEKNKNDFSTIKQLSTSESGLLRKSIGLA